MRALGCSFLVNVGLFGADIPVGRQIDDFNSNRVAIRRRAMRREQMFKGRTRRYLQFLRRLILLGMLVVPIAVASAGETAGKVMGRDRLIQFLTPITGDEPRAVDLHVPFKLGSSALTPVARKQLDELIAALTSKGLKGLRVDILGHTDALGSHASNQKLSERRAHAVMQYLVAKAGLDRRLLRAEGLGETRPRPEFDLLAAAQRRVEVVVHPPAKKRKYPNKPEKGHTPIN